MPINLKVPEWDCADGTPDEDHDWKLVRDWYGDPEVVNGTCDIRYLECRQCGKQIEDDGRIGDDDYYEEDYRQDS